MKNSFSHISCKQKKQICGLAEKSFDETMRIAVCDDEIVFTSRYDEYIERLSGTFPKTQCDVYFSGEDLLRCYDAGEKPYDLIFLDIEMKGIDGLETARKLRESDENVLIVYVTNYTEYVFESFNVSPFRFLKKPITFEKFSEIMIAAYAKMKKQKKALYFMENRNQLRLYCEDIYYIESSRRLLLLHAVTGLHKVYGRMGELSQQLEQQDFVLVHKSFLVNMNYIVEFQKNSVKMINRDIIPISEGRGRAVKEAHMKFLLRSCTNGH